MAVRLLWAYFFTNSLPLLEFFGCIYKDRTLLPASVSSALEICTAHASAKTGWPAHEIRHLLLVDEIAQCGKEVAVELLKALGRAVDAPAAHLLPVVTAVDALLTAKGATASGRLVRWIQLKTLDEPRVASLFERVYSRLASDSVEVNARILDMCIVEANGHARLLANTFAFFNAHLDTAPKLELSFEKVTQSIIDSSGLPKASISAIALGLLGEPVNSAQKLPEMAAGYTEPTANDLVHSGLYINSVDSEPNTLLPLLAGFHVRKFLKETSDTSVIALEKFPAGTPARNSAQSLTILLKQIFEKELMFAIYSPGASLPKSLASLHRSRGVAFEYFHCYAELINLHAQAVCDTFLPPSASRAVFNGRYVESSLRTRYRLDDDYLESRTDTDREVLETTLLWPLTSLKESKHTVGFAKLIKDVSDARDPKLEFVPHFHLFTDNMTGFDAALVVREARCPTNVWCILFEMKHSLPDASTHLNISELNEKTHKMKLQNYHNQLRDAGASRLIYVIAAWRRSRDNVSIWEPPADFPYTTLILDESRLGRFYTSLRPYGSYFAGDAVLNKRRRVRANQRN